MIPNWGRGPAHTYTHPGVRKCPGEGLLAGFPTVSLPNSEAFRSKALLSDGSLSELQQSW